MFGLYTERTCNWSSWIIDTKMLQYMRGEKERPFIVTAARWSRKWPNHSPLELYILHFLIFKKMDSRKCEVTKRHLDTENLEQQFKASIWLYNLFSGVEIHKLGFYWLENSKDCFWAHTFSVYFEAQKAGFYQHHTPPWSVGSCVSFRLLLYFVYQRQA